MYIGDSRTKEWLGGRIMPSLYSQGFPGLVGRYGTILIDPPWRFQNRTGKVAPEHRRLRRYETLSFEEIAALPVEEYAMPKSHLYMWCPNAPKR
jgi:N6-adenosine-specific RNA methylase IME4